MDLTTYGFVLAVIGILVTIIIAIRQRRPKRVVYDVLVNRRIIARTTYQATGALAVIYGDRHLKDPHLVVIRVANGGKVEIRPEDWEEPLSLNTSAEIIDSGVVGASSKDLQPEITSGEGHEVCLSKDLLNQGEWYDVQMLLDGSGGVSGVSARIAGARVEAKRTRAGIRQLMTPPGFSWPPRGVLLAAFGLIAAVVIYSVAAALGLLSIPPVKTTPTTRVPELTGKPLSRVIPELHQAKLHLGAERFVPSSGPSNIVVDQYPSAGSKLDVGGLVSIAISQRS